MYTPIYFKNLPLAIKRKVHRSSFTKTTHYKCILKDLYMKKGKYNKKKKRIKKKEMKK
jgi:hypothetical protein